MAKKSKQGAPKGSANAQKGASPYTVPVAFRCTDAQAEQLAAHAAAQGVGKAEYIRLQLFGSGK